MDLTNILNLSGSYLTQQIRYYEKHGELIPYKKDSITEECRYFGMSDEEIQQKIDEETKAFVDMVKASKEDVIQSINSLSPTEKDHTVYRIISKGYNEDSYNYFEKMKNLKPGEEIVLDSTPIYVSTSAKKTVGNYGVGHGNILFEIKLPKGSKLLRFPSIDGIEQCIMKPNAKFKVVDNKEYKNDFHYITLAYSKI